MSEPGLDDATKTAALVLLTAIVKKPLARVGEIIDIRMSLWQFRNMYAVGERSRDFLSKKGMKIEDLPPKLREVVPILESAKNEDDPTLQEMWASLLAASLDLDSPEAVLPHHDILKSITPFEAKVLAVFGTSITDFMNSLTPEDGYKTQVGKLANTLSADVKTTSLALRHLEHQGLILLPESEVVESIATAFGPGSLTKGKFICLSEVGQAFFQRCTHIPDNV